MSEYYKVEEICKVKGGKRIPQGCTLQDNPNKHPYIRILDMYQGRILNISEEMQYVRDEYWNIIKNYIVNKGDVILAIVGNTLGMASIIGDTLDGANLTENCCKFDDLDIDKVRTLFLYYSLISPLNQKNIEKFRVGSSQPKLPIYNVNQLLIPKIDVQIQDKIVNILSAMDSKIENNKRINKELESMAKTFYDYWFLQFEFPNEDGKPYKSSGGKMVWNEELGKEIPKGWGTGNLYDIAEFINGLACQKYRPVNNNKKLPVIKITEMHDGITDNTEYVRADIPEKNIINDGDILFSWSATLETMVWNGGKGGLNQHIFKVEPKGYAKYYIYMQLSAYISNFVHIAEARKTTMGHITTEHLKQSKIVLPPRKTTENYNDKVCGIFNKIACNNMQNRELIVLRDFLLPLLMNAQVSFKDQAEQ